ncbi:MAG: cytochrome c3 family protein [Saprospiraceae bacterium]
MAIADDCAGCHNGDYNNTPNTCIECHQTDIDGTTDPNHVNNQFSTDCTQCHNEEAWIPSTFDHNTIWPLNGAHALISDCIDCHTGGNYTNTPNTCVECHQADYDGTTNPDHAASQFGTDCTVCHNETAWVPSTFDHNAIWPLIGEHENANCIDCHIGGDYTNTPTSCVACHQADFDGSTNPNHTVLGIPTDCETCHTPNGWDPALFPIHDNYYQLNGAHIAIADDCVSCHNGDYNNTPTTCAGCHTDDYNNTTNPSHVFNQFSTDCIQCHNEDAWIPSTFDHNTIWPLNGAHAGVPNCVDCHVGGNYTNTPTNCSGCHIDDYNNTTNPNHLTNQFSTDCTQCHDETAWVPSTFDHNSIWPLNGAHANVPQCVDCHVGGNYTNTPTDCAGCHIDDYNNTNNPNHINNQFSTDCTQCHDETAWIPSTFDHNTIWPLNGAHANVPQCVDCHVGGNYVNTSTECFSCHESDYNSANNPNHLLAGFPTNCESCHNENAWVPSTFDHDNMYFPIYSGKHKDEWTTCDECHTIPGNFMAFSCIDCHEHDNPVEVGQDHQGVSGYSYSSSACYACHPDGSD